MRMCRALIVVLAVVVLAYPHASYATSKQEMHEKQKKQKKPPKHGSPADLQEQLTKIGRMYTDLTDDEKKKLKRMVFLRKECSFKKMEDMDDGVQDPIALALRVYGSCSEQDEKISEFMLGTLRMKGDFVSEYMESIKDDVQTSLVPHIIKYRDDKQKQAEEFRP